MEKNHRVELLSPAGNPDGFYGAVHAGADAVYLAGDRFGARAYAENFTTEELVECIRYGHLLGRKIYLTVNTLLKEHELAQLYDYLAPFYEAGLDAVIVQDLGVFRFIREHFPDLKLHVSTQMTLCSSYGVSLLRDIGASRIVPARELSLQELIILKQSGVEIEAFIHGAMCYCYSGQCLFSSILGGRSGNRGRCAQPCRLPYSVIADGSGHGECYPLSLKDMCTMEHIPQLIEAGIDSFKIEGRMKKAKYTAGVTDIYRRYIDRYYEVRERCGPLEAAKTWHVEKKDSEILSSLYIRSGIEDGYYFRQNGREMITMDSPAYSRSDDALLAQIYEKYLKAPLKLPINIKASFQTGRPAEVVFRWQGLTARVQGPVVERAQKQPINRDNVERQLGKLGESVFWAAETDIGLDEDCFYPLKQINELRRAAVCELERQILLYRGYEAGKGQKDAFRKEPQIKPRMAPEKPHPYAVRPKGCAVSLCTKEQLKSVTDWFSAWQDCMPLRIYVDGDLIIQDMSSVFSLCSGLPENTELYVSLPYILRESDRKYLENLCQIVEKCGIFQGFLARSMDGVGFVHEKGTMPCRTDAGVYVWNKTAMQEIASLANGFCLPYELKASEQWRLLSNSPCENFPCEKIVYSRIPMMITANCLLRTTDRCRKSGRNSVISVKSEKRSSIILKDRCHREFPVSANCLHCMNIIYNSVPFSLHREISKWGGCVDLRLDFTLESGAEVRQLLDTFFKDAPFPWKEYTTGHEKRGVE